MAEKTQIDWIGALGSNTASEALGNITGATGSGGIGGTVEQFGGAPYSCILTLMDYSRPHVRSEAKYDAKARLKFPLPMEMRDDTDVNYTNVDLQTVGDAINGNIGSGPGMSAALLRNLPGILTAAGDVASTAGGVLAGSEAVKNALKKAFDVGYNVFQPEQIASAASQSFGVAANPNPSVQFIGPALRTFTLTWQFNPRNQRESNALQKVIRILKSSALPTMNEKGNTALLNYPRMVKINFYPWDGKGKTTDRRHGWTQESIFRYGFCVMQSVNVNYAPSQATAFFKDDQRPTMVTISINFKEIEYLLSEHWADSVEYGGEGEGQAATSPDPASAPDTGRATAAEIKQFERDNNVTITTNPDGSSTMTRN